MKNNVKKAALSPRRVAAAIEKLLDHAAADVNKGRKFWMNLASGRADARKVSR
ncbi:MAG: hypothetical protein K8F90_14790 [Hyphomicrobiales bacterium]|nr:hypothetical protein [Hyphomicrobiales bacterium]MBZ0261853.1 hypothetical protein [Hyphomicrobiales bacterium]